MPNREHTEVRHRSHNFTRQGGRPNTHNVRLIVDANCTSCGLIAERTRASMKQDAAARHIAKTGHVVILSGTVDLPQRQIQSSGTAHAK
jgi:hypothetical protein